MSFGLSIIANIKLMIQFTLFHLTECVKHFKNHLIKSYREIDIGYIFITSKFWKFPRYLRTEK